MKKKLGETISSRDPVAQANELLCKVLAYNITVLIHEAFEHGILLPGTKDPPAKTDDTQGPQIAPDPSASADAWVPRATPSWEDN